MTARRAIPVFLLVLFPLNVGAAPVNLDNFTVELVNGNGGGAAAGVASAGMVAETTTVDTSADLLISKTDSPDPVTAGTDLTYAITVSNVGPSDAAAVSLTDTLPAGTTFVSLTSPGAWSCTTPAVGATGTVDCSIATLPAGGGSFFLLVVNTDAALVHTTVITNTATVTSTTTDPSPANNSATATTVVGIGSADLSISKTDTPTDPVNAGDNVTYTIAVQNSGPSAATSVTMSDALSIGTSFVSVSAPAGWTCTTPAVGAPGTVTCTTPTLGVTSAVFAIMAEVAPFLVSGTTLSNKATVSAATTDPNALNNSDTETTLVNASADMQVTKTDTPDPVTAGTNITYTITVTSAGPSNADNLTLADTVPAGTTFVSFTAPPGWGCTTPAAGGTGAINCSTAGLPAGSVATFTLVVAADPALTSGTVITNTVTVASSTSDPNSANNTDTETTAVLSPANVTGTKTVTGTFLPGGSITYTIVLTNSGGGTQQDNPGAEFVDVLPSQLTLVSANAASGTATATIATNTVTWDGSIAPSASVTITINATINSSVTPGTTVTNQATIHYDADGNGTNEASRPTDNPAAPGGSDATAIVVAPASHEAIPTLDEWALLGLAVMLGMIAVLVMKR